MLDGDKLRAGADGPKYPLYSLTLGIIVLSAPVNAAHKGARDKLVKLLLGLQTNGGWGYAGSRQPPNISATVYAVGALSLAGMPVDSPALVAAKTFVESCQNFGEGGDGGFFFSPGEPDGNKAGPKEGGGYRSYGSATSDGVRALLRLGHTPGSPRVVAARDWLGAHFDPSQNPGDFRPGDEVRRHSAYYYYAWSVAHALRALGTKTAGAGDKPWGQSLAEELLRRQGKDGAWKNQYSEVRENDPIVATSFAMAALGVSRIAITGEYRTHAGPP